VRIDRLADGTSELQQPASRWATLESASINTRGPPFAKKEAHVSNRRWIIALCLTAPLFIGVPAMTKEVAPQFNAVELDDHPELEISSAFGVGIDSGGAGSTSKSITQGVGSSKVPPASPNMLPTIGDAVCSSVVGVCACVASPSSTCSVDLCEALCLKTP